MNFTTVLDALAAQEPPRLARTDESDAWADRALAELARDGDEFAAASLLDHFSSAGAGFSRFRQLLHHVAAGRIAEAQETLTEAALARGPWEV